MWRSLKQWLQQSWMCHIIHHLEERGVALNGSCWQSTMERPDRAIDNCHGYCQVDQHLFQKHLLLRKHLTDGGECIALPASVKLGILCGASFSERGWNQVMIRCPVEGSALSSKPCLLWLRSHKLLTWPPCGTELTGWMHDDLSLNPKFELMSLMFCFVVGEQCASFVFWHAILQSVELTSSAAIFCFTISEHVPFTCFSNRFCSQLFLLLLVHHLFDTTLLGLVCWDAHRVTDLKRFPVWIKTGASSLEIRTGKVSKLVTLWTPYKLQQDRISNH